MASWTSDDDVKIIIIKDINNDYLNKQVSHLILHFINEKFNTS